MALLALAVFVGGTVLWVGGIAFHLQFGSALFSSFVLVAFVLPAALNVWIMLRGGGGETIAQRAMAGVRGFGMLLLAVGCFVSMMVEGPILHCVGVIFGSGIVLYLASILVEFYLGRRRKCK